MLHYAVAVHSLNPLAAYLSLRPVVTRAKQPVANESISEYEPDEAFVLVSCPVALLLVEVDR